MSGYGDAQGGSSGFGGGSSQYSESNRYAASLYLDVTGDASKWKAGGPAMTAEGAPSKLNQALAAGKGLSIDRSLPTYDIAVVGVQPRKEPLLRDVGFGPMNRYVEYVVKVTRLRDGATSVVCHRYSALRAFHAELLELGIMKHIDAPEFPKRKMIAEETFLLERADVNAAFVKTRKEELHHFLRRLFNQNPGLWEQEIVQNFFNMQSLDVGRKYAERSRALTEGGGTVSGLDPLSHYNPGDPAQWNPYTMAMQASEASKGRNYPQQQQTNGGSTSGGLFGRANTGANAASGNNSNNVLGGADPNMVRSLCELGFCEGQAATALRAANNNPDLAAEYCMSGIPPSAQQASLPPPAAPQPPPVPAKTGGGGWFGFGRSTEKSEKSEKKPLPPVPPAPSSSGAAAAAAQQQQQHSRRHTAGEGPSGNGGYYGGGYNTGSYGGFAGASPSYPSAVGQPSGAAASGQQPYTRYGGGGSSGVVSSSTYSTPTYREKTNAAPAGSGTRGSAAANPSFAPPGGQMGQRGPGSGGPGTVDV